MDAGRGRKLGRRQDSKESRDSSVSSTSREVRCGCQYFQSDSLLPERHTLVGTRPSRPSSRNMGDHEYEPISPPASQPASPPLLKVTDQEGEEEKITEAEKIDFKPIIDRSEYQFLRIPLDRDLVIPIDKEEIENTRYDEEPEQNVHEMTAQEIQDQMEQRFFAATPTTTISRTDGEFNTSQMDSSGLDELPLKKDARRGFNTRGFQQRLQSQAGRLKTRIRNISRPKINLPERPKLNFPDKSKFNFPERPKFNIKRPDLKMPNFSFGKTKTSSIRRPLRDRSQIPSNQSTVGSKKNIFDSINFRTYPRIFSKKKKAAQGRRALTPPARMETESTPPSSPASRTGPFNQRWTQRFKDIKFADDDEQSNLSNLKKPSFDDDVEDDSAPFRDTDFKAAVNLSDKKQIKAESSSSIPGSDREQQSSGSSSERHRAGVIEEIDSDEFFLREKGLSREDVDVSRYLSLEIRDAFRSPKNALARLDGDLYDQDNESYEFELPQHALGEPIRLSMEALRKQSLEQIRMTPERDTDCSREEEEIEEPVRPQRTRSLRKRSTRSKSEEPKPDSENQFNTYPPDRPNRVRKYSSHSKHSISTDNYHGNEQEDIHEDVNMRQPSIPSLAITDTTKELSPTRYIDESSEALNEPPWHDEHQPPLPPKRRKSTRDSSQDNESISAHQYEKEQWLEDVKAEDMVLDTFIALQSGTEPTRPLQNGYYDSPPQLPMRKSKSQATSLADEDRTSRGADSLISETRTHLTEDMDIKPDIKSFIPDNCGYAVVEKPVVEYKPTVAEKPNFPPLTGRKKKAASQLTALKNQSINFFFTYPRRAIKKSLHKQSPAPLRPDRNYTSIGPARPPRRNRVFREPVYEGEFIPLKGDNETALNEDEQKAEHIDNEKIENVQLQSEIDTKNIEKPDSEDVQEARDLQSGDIIEKMKGRPLPPPPRPPRKTKEDLLDDDNERDLGSDNEEQIVVERIDILVGHTYREETEKENLSRESPEVLQVMKDICGEQKQSEFEDLSLEVSKEPPIKNERRKKSLTTAKAVQNANTIPIEFSVSTQTDQLPDRIFLEEEQKTADEYSKSEESCTKAFEITSEKIVEPEKKVETIIEHKVVVIPTPETEILKAKKIHVAELDVEKLNVAELQAQKITVSDIDGVSMQVTELTSKSGHLVVSGFELPSSFLEAITPQIPAPVIQIQSSTQTPPQTTDSQTNTTPQEAAPPPVIDLREVKQTPIQPAIPSPPLAQRRPSPPPTIVIETPQGQSSPAYVPAYNIPSSPPPRSPQRTRTHGHDSEEELRVLPRRRRHHSQKQPTQYSSDEDEEEYPSFPIARKLHQRDPTSSELIRQLFTIWQASLMRGVNNVVEGMNTAFPEGEKRKDAQTAACIILVLFAGLIMLGFGTDRTVHHHHWDFLPPNPK